MFDFYMYFLQFLLQISTQYEVLVYPLIIYFYSKVTSLDFNQLIELFLKYSWIIGTDFCAFL